MNKYQKRAVLELVGMVALAALVGFTMSAIATYFTAAQVITGLGIAVMGYCFYIVYKIRVDQLKSIDELNKSRE